MSADTHTAADGGPRTDTEIRIWDTLSAQPQTTTQVVAGAGVGRSTAGKALARWAAAGLIIRHDAPDHTTATTWLHTPDEQHEPGADTAEPDDAPPPDDHTPPEPAEALTADAPADDDAGAAEEPESPASAGPSAGRPERLKSGGLYGLVEDYLRDRPGQEFGPSQIGKDLNRSSGAVNNALEKMAAEEVAVKTQAAPKRFSIAPDDE
ncbi:hypothetical protein INP57_25760 [Saccharopolyspora sp. HNM0986]|uniref:hypothetical protein n=1 Tax=Saccharopolyspora galaxeae TaxID=2781241 RepID=UPI00190CB433|nr:hypothetical protein [Saccharopolyspora sp. HNM0986]MBK0870222.1 hypothetical protein [Saccharopolyspora sp. HNM0986]